jgi:hypothetical protein
MQRSPLVFPFLQLPDEQQEDILLRLNDADVFKLVKVAREANCRQVFFIQLHCNALCRAASCQKTMNVYVVRYCTFVCMQELASPSGPPLGPAGCTAISCVGRAYFSPGEHLVSIPCSS